MLQEKKRPRKLQGAQEWLCRTCRAVLGILDGEKEKVRIKYKDHLTYVEGGKVTVVCRACAAPNTIEQLGEGQPKEATLPE